ncbi:ZinT/AdcA family metal-binding protein, partial [uncultured Agrobacterium sp.]
MKLTQALALSVSSLLLLSAAAVAQEKSAPSKSETHNHAHNHSHGHSHGSSDVYKGYFEDSAVKERPLSDWEGDWQSVYPYLVDGTLDPVMQHKAEHGKKSA